MLSRVQSIEQLFIVGELPPEKIYTKKAAEDELKRLENIAVNRNPGPWESEDTKALKIATLNCAGFVAHKEDMKVDRKLLNGNIINFLETSIPFHFDNSGLQLKDKKSEFFNVGKGKGIATFISEDISYQVDYSMKYNIIINI